MANPSETLDKHFEENHPTPPHEVMRAQAIEQAAKYGIPYEVAVAAIDEKLCRAEELYCAILEQRETIEGKAGRLRAEIDAQIMGNDVMNFANAERDTRLSELGAIAIKDIRDEMTGGNLENLAFSDLATSTV